MNPRVSFVVPCYNLGHLLSECVTSILSQTYGDLEVLIMDDCSPDQTPEVAQSFRDPRVTHVRNDPNLGHLRNYNKGIGLARGKYVWLISADDCLRRTCVVERYVRLMEDHPGVGYVFCPAVRLEEGREGDVIDYSWHGSRDAIFDGRRFLATLVKANTIAAPTGMVRKECYDRLGMFPLDMPWGGDWYLWCLFALHYDVAYLAEPMVYYRRHALTMTNQLMSGSVRHCSEEDVAIPWIIKRKAEEAGDRSVVAASRRALAVEYARSVATQRYKSSGPVMTLEEFEASLHQNASDAGEERWIRARVYVGIADAAYWQCDFERAREFYAKGLREDVRMPKVLLKYALLALGTAGIACRNGLPSLRRAISGAK